MDSELSLLVEKNKLSGRLEKIRQQELAVRVKAIMDLAHLPPKSIMSEEVRFGHVYLIAQEILAQLDLDRIR